MGRGVRTSAVVDTAAFASFYDAAVREVFRYFHRATGGDRLVAEDLTQETLWASAQAFRGGQADAVTMPWLMGVARHKLIDHYRRVSRDERKLEMAYNPDADISREPSFDDIDGAGAMDLLEQLSPIHRLVLVLRYVDDLSVNEVARSLGRSVRATESLIVRSRRALERLMREVHDV